MPKDCEHCGTENPPAAKYCRRCGKPWTQSWLRSATRVTPVMQQWRRLRHQMTRKEVRIILGEPARIETTATGSPGSERWRYEYECANRGTQRASGTVEFALPDGTVLAWVEPDWPTVGGSA
jgi:hypothetical protein